jgi:hypothetical protein
MSSDYVKIPNRQNPADQANGWIYLGTQRCIASLVNTVGLSTAFAYSGGAVTAVTGLTLPWAFGAVFAISMLRVGWHNWQLAAGSVKSNAIAQYVLQTRGVNRNNPWYGGAVDGLMDATVLLPITRPLRHFGIIPNNF